MWVEQLQLNGGRVSKDLERVARLLGKLEAAWVGVHEAETDEAGAAMFGAVSPGTWALDDETANWCHAESDNVTATGDVVVEAGQETTVWLFYCEGGS